MKKTLLLTTLLLISLSGCYWNTPVIDLISPPKLTTEQTEIYNALTNSKGAALTLKYPKTGDYLSAFVFFGDRAMVFYELTGASSEPTILLTFLEKRNNKWESTNDIPLSATDVEKVEFSTLGDSPNENIIISYSILNQPGKSLCVISLVDSLATQDGRLEKKQEKVYERNFCVYYEIGDFNNSGSNMLLSISGGGGDIIQPTIDFAKWRDGSFGTVYSLLASPNVNEYVRSVKNVVFTPRENENGEEINDEKALLFLEYSRTDTIFGTEIIVWTNPNRVEQGRLVRPQNIIYERSQSLRLELAERLYKRPNQFTALAYARDICGDGAVNAVGNRTFLGYTHESISSSERARAAIWYEVTDDNLLEERFYTYLSINNDYVFFFPKGWEESVTVTISHDEVVFWKYDHEKHESIFDVTGDDENRLLSIITVPKGSKPERDDASDYSLFRHNHNPDFDYYTKIINDSMRPITLRNALRIF